jgi:nitroreductase
MALLDIIRKRYSCRSYQDKPVEKEKMDQVFEAARLAPSAKNLQDWRFVVVSEREIKYQVAEAANNQMFIADAGIIIAACSNSDHVMRCGQAVGPIDVAIALEHVALQAAELGLATCWIGSFYPDKVRTVLDIPDDIAVIELMAVGYPADGPKEADRVPMNEILCYNRWKF